MVLSSLSFIVFLFVLANTVSAPLNTNLPNSSAQISSAATGHHRVMPSARPSAPTPTRMRNHNVTAATTTVGTHQAPITGINLALARLRTLIHVLLIMINDVKVSPIRMKTNQRPSNNEMAHVDLTPLNLSWEPQHYEVKGRPINAPTDGFSQHIVECLTRMQSFYNAAKQRYEYYLTTIQIPLKPENTKFFLILFDLDFIFQFRQLASKKFLEYIVARCGVNEPSIISRQEIVTEHRRLVDAYNEHFGEAELLVAAQVLGRKLPWHCMRFSVLTPDTFPFFNRPAKLPPIPIVPTTAKAGNARVDPTLDRKIATSEHDPDVLSYVINLTVPYRRHRDELLRTVALECKRHASCQSNMHKALVEFRIRKSTTLNPSSNVNNSGIISASDSTEAICTHLDQLTEEMRRAVGNETSSASKCDDNEIIITILQQISATLRRSSSTRSVPDNSDLGTEHTAEISQEEAMDQLMDLLNINAAELDDDEAKSTASSTSTPSGGASTASATSHSASTAPSSPVDIPIALSLPPKNTLIRARNGIMGILLRVWNFEPWIIDDDQNISTTETTKVRTSAQHGTKKTSG